MSDPVTPVWSVDASVCSPHLHGHELPVHIVVIVTSMVIHRDMCTNLPLFQYYHIREWPLLTDVMWYRVVITVIQ